MKKSIFLIFAALLCAMSVDAKTIYLKPGPWQADGATFGVFAWKDGGASTSIMMTLVPNTTDVYQAEVTDQATKCIFLRMKNTATSFNWNDEWNRKGDLSIPSDKNCCIVTGYGENTENVSWSFFDPLATNVFLVGEMNEWNTTRHEFRKTNDGDATASVTINLTAGTYSFKLMINGAWKGNTGTMQRGGGNVHTGGWEFNEEGGDDKNCKITADVSGDYTFTWNITGKKLTVSYPKFPDLSGQPNTIYFKPSVAWKSANARFAAYFFQGETPTERWADLTDTDGDGIYEVSNNKRFISVIFVRMNPAHTENKWENDYKWDQTADLFIPTNGDDRYTMTATGANNFDSSGKWSLVKHTISATADPVEGGSVEGANTYNYGTSVTLTATANPGYEFVNWTKAGEEVSTDASYTFTVTEDVDLVANFAKEVYTRTTTIDSYGTICLPFGSDDYSGAEFYEVAYLVEGTGLWLDQVEEGATLVAGKPYIFKATATELVVVSNATEVAVPVDGENGLTGTFTDIVAGGLTGNYIIAENQVWRAGTGATLSANRAYIANTVPTTPQAKLPGRRRVQMGENAATGLDNITNGENTVIKTIENGQLIIIRNGEKFNAQGVRF